TIQRILADAAAHAARVVRLGAALRQPSVGREQRTKCRPQRLDAGGGVSDRRRQARRRVDERADFRRVDQKAEMLVMIVMAEIAHRSLRPESLLEPGLGPRVGWHRYVF